jgi:hypothetical protein
VPVNAIVPFPKFIFFLIVLFSLHPQLSAGEVYFVAPDGNDMNPGTLEQPFATIVKAHSLVAAGDTIFVRGGVFSLAARINLNKSGKADTLIHLFAYPGERPILDFSQMLEGSSNQGIRLQGWYWHIRGLDIKGAGDNGMQINNGSYNIIEFCAFYENRDTGLQLDQGASYNQIINCDSYNNADSNHGNADGFAPKLNVGTGNYFYGCRAWNNSDDGFDGYMRGADNVETTLENCWIFKNGYLANESASNGNGNGIKMGGGDNGNADSLRHNITLINCLTFDNRVKGFDQNNNRGSMTLLNCTGYRNGTNYQISGAIKSGSLVTVTNSLALGPMGGLANHVVQTTNSWMPPFSVTSADFVSIDTTGVRGPRNSDGSLPDIPFMRLAQGSPLIDAGTNVGLPFKGIAPDLGCFESDYTTSIIQKHALPTAFSLYQNYPNPFNPRTTIRFDIASSAFTSLTVHDMLGREVATLVNQILEPGMYEIGWDASELASGVYMCRLVSGGSAQTQRMILMK